MMEGVYGRKRHIGKEGGFRKHKRNIGGIQEKDECGSKKARKDRNSRRKRFQEGRFTREIYSKDVIWMG